MHLRITQLKQIGSSGHALLVSMFLFILIIKLIPFGNVFSLT